MVSYCRSDMKIPLRPAPLPPSSKRDMNLHRGTSAFDWSDGKDPFSKQTVSTRPVSAHFGRPPGEKKKPPPRPPPPKFAQRNQQRQVPTRPTNVLSGIFTRNTSSRMPQHTISMQQKSLNKESPATATVTSLIDFYSPASSPTPTTRSSSDGLSVNSFGSDGSVSNNGQTPCGGSSSLFESGFEDDFDFFGGLSSSSSFGTPLGERNDPWSVVKPEDPFSPPRQQSFSVSSASVQKVTGNAPFYKQSNPSSSGAVGSTSVTSMPTIIRPKPGRPPTLPRMNETAGDHTSGASFPFATKSRGSSHSVPNGDSDDDTGKWSPPMPSIPPPPLPADVLQESDSNGPSPELPARPFHFQAEDLQKPYGIALYDYSATHPDDLSFQANGVIFLLHRVNDDWLYGQFGHNQGMFPANYVRVVIPLSNSSIGQQRQQAGAHTVTALYPFAAETWDDLELKAGSSVYVISRINGDWLYGESNGKVGQFPAAFVDRIPSNLPQRTK